MKNAFKKQKDAVCMKTTIPQLSLRGHTFLTRVRIRGVLLTLIVGLLAASFFALQPASSAQAKNAQQQSTTVRVQPLDTTAIRLVTFAVSNNSIYYRQSDNDGGAWSAWTNLGN